MTSKSEKDRAKQIQDRCQAILMKMLKDEDNKYCVDCDAKGPRWASWNLGIFLCIRCAGIHRNLGVHISKVKSVTLDSWTPEQVVSLQQMGNSRARAVYEANLPDAFRRPQTDSPLEAFIRSKYEQKRYIASEWVPPVLPKINWDKEIEEEMEKQKRKKKATLSTLPTPIPSAESKSNKSESVPKPLPKPKLSSPKPSHRTSTSSNSADLLGLSTSPPPNVAKPAETNQDIFNNFFTTPEQSTTTQNPTEKSAVDDLKSEEDSFFNQSAPTEQQKSKLTKDSILALYNQAPPVNNIPNYNQTNMSYNIGQFQPPAPNMNHGFAPNQSTGNAQQFNANYNRFVQQPHNGDGYHNSMQSQQLPQQFGSLSLNQPVQSVFGTQHNTTSTTNTLWQ